jgi:hypothetical protein
VDGAFDLNGRGLKNNDRGNLKIPSYTCANQGDFKVLVTIRVAFDGTVKSASVSDPSIPSCIKNKALEYARNSKFDGSDKPLESGTITYTFRSN